MKRFALGTLLFLLIVAAAIAGDCPQHHAQVQQIITIPAAQVLVPVYAAVYAPPQPQGGQPAAADVLAEILAELRAMRAELQALRNPAQAQAIANVAPILRVACARCHSPAGADKDGGGFTLLDFRGELLATLSERDRQRVANRVGRNSMPPAPAKLEPGQKEAILKAFEKGK